MATPDFLVIGAMKSGTTTLCNYLERHPEIFMSRPKEPGFFSRKEVFDRGFDWYQSLFAAAAPDQVCGEGSTCYTRWPQFDNVAEKVHAALPQVKLLYLMRHPVERSYSHYRHLMEDQFLSTSKPIFSFQEAVARIGEIVETSLYMIQIGRFLSLFPRDQFFFLTTDDLNQSPDSLLGEIQRFLGVKEAQLTGSGPFADNRAGDAFRRRATRQHLRSIRTHPVVTSLSKVVPAPIRRALRKRALESAGTQAIANERQKEFESRLSPLDGHMRAELLDVFREPTRELETFLGRSLPAWFE